MNNQIKKNHKYLIARKTLKNVQYHLLNITVKDSWAMY